MPHLCLCPCSHPTPPLWDTLLVSLPAPSHLSHAFPTQPRPSPSAPSELIFLTHLGRLVTTVLSRSSFRLITLGGNYWAAGGGGGSLPSVRWGGEISIRGPQGKGVKTPSLLFPAPRAPALAFRVPCLSPSSIATHILRASSVLWSPFLCIAPFNHRNTSERLGLSPLHFTGEKVRLGDTGPLE